MELTEVIENRRSIRKYLEKKVSKEQITEILKAGILAPSGHNRQPWHFVVVTNQQIKDKIADLTFEKCGDFATQTQSVIKSAPVIINIFNSGEVHEKEELFDILSIGASVENMCLKAVDMGLGSLWIGLSVYASKEIEELLEIKDKRLVAILAIGYKDQDPKPRPRKELSEVIDWKL